MSVNAKYQHICQTAKQAALLQSAADALEWDERTGMPPAAGEYRAEQVACLRGMAHQKRTETRYCEYLEQLHAELEAGSDRGAQLQNVSIRKMHRDLQRDKKLSTDLVEHLAALTVRGQQQWDAARNKNQYNDFKPILNEMINCKREVGNILSDGTNKSAYESLIDEYEPNATTGQIDQLFTELRIPLVQLIQQIHDSKQQPQKDIFHRPLPIHSQRQLSREVAQAIGFSFDRGRLDETSHPFCTTLGPNDCRILTRYDSNHLGTGLFGTMHEAGHGMYEQGLDPESFGLPLGSYASLGIHESQSRMWENQVGRSRPFWHWIAARLKTLFPSDYASVSVDALYFAANEIKPSLIRVEADEATYNLHIIIRYDLEKQLIEGSLGVNELQEAWNERYEQDLGVIVEQDSDGVLQDVHWSAGLFGYFPTYTIGNLIAAQLFAKAEQSIDQLDQKISVGQFHELLDWTREKVHRHGRSMTSEEIVHQATNQTLSPDYLIDYLRKKLEPLYRL